MRLPSGFTNCYSGAMSDAVRRHYELYPYPHYPLLASVRRCDTYATNGVALWSRFNGELPQGKARNILIAGCGSFAPYPFAIANPNAQVTALDLSEKSLKRARLHCLLHGVRSVEFVAGDLCAPEVSPGPYGIIDAYGVLHHLKDPLAGLLALKGRLCEGGIVRVMVYSRYTRREEESIRRALRLLRVSDPAVVLQMVKRSKPESRLRRFFEESDEVSFRSGLADALLNPQVQTFRIDPFLELVAKSGLEPLLFAHPGALAEVPLEVERIRALERQRQSPGNFVVYLGHKVRGPASLERAFFQLNPCLLEAVSGFKWGPVDIPGRLGQVNEPLNFLKRRFLHRFKRPVPAHKLSSTELTWAQAYWEKLFLMRYL